ncbi:hypothetical protein BT69DRAFT_1313736 [Atractiella rhizophila]|nr:hypothetical protein BT69DRAFT_1313736 [Atractiella rhizophila]
MLGLLSLLLASAAAYQVEITSESMSRQVCSGMWGKANVAGAADPFIEIIFGPSSKGYLALVVYEWADARYLGVDPTGTNVENEWGDDVSLILLLPALLNCVVSEYTSALHLQYHLVYATVPIWGNFIVSLPDGKGITTTTIWTTHLHLEEEKGPVSVCFSLSPIRRTEYDRDGVERYEIPRTGYYCVGTVPVTLTVAGADGEAGEESYYEGVVDFSNTFKGYLPASEYPKVVFYGTLVLVYLALGATWGWQCWKFREDLLPIQHYITGTILFLIVEMVSIWGYYAYLNAYGSAGFGRVLLVLVAILNAGRNSLSFFLLLLVSMGYGIVRPSLGSVMTKVRILAGVHFFFAIAVVPLEEASYFILIFIFPLAFSLTAFMMWIMYSLNATIADLAARRQTYKKQMFTRLYRILIGAALVIFAFFGGRLSSISFSNRLDEDYAPDTWKTRWFLLDGWLGLLYLSVFASIAFLWRPTAHNRRLLMSDELATDEDDEQLDTLRPHGAEDDDDEDEDDAKEGEYRPLTGRNRDGGMRVGNDSLVFDIGDEEDDEDDERKGLTSGKKKEPPPYEV